jgi:hypothetical protein
MNAFNLNNMKVLIITCVSSLFLCACNNKSNKDESPAEKRTALYSNARIVGTTKSSNLGTNYSIEAGSYLVFDRYYKASDNILIADDEYEERFAFQVNPVGDSFSFSDASLQDLNPVLAYNCYCMRHDSLHSIAGTINGTKQGSNGWNVNVDMKFIFLDKIRNQGTINSSRYDTLLLKFKGFYAIMN